jgi:hypothetical protein
MVVFGAITGRDPRSLGRFECSAYELGLSATQAEALQQVAFDQLAAGNRAMTPAASTRATPARCAPPPAPAGR